MEIWNILVKSFPSKTHVPFQKTCTRLSKPLDNHLFSSYFLTKNKIDFADYWRKVSPGKYYNPSTFFTFFHYSWKNSFMKFLTYFHQMWANRNGILMGNNVVFLFH